MGSSGDYVSTSISHYGTDGRKMWASFAQRKTWCRCDWLFGMSQKLKIDARFVAVVNSLASYEFRRKRWPSRYFCLVCVEALKKLDTSRVTLKHNNFMIHFLLLSAEKIIHGWPNSIKLAKTSEAEWYARWAFLVKWTSCDVATWNSAETVVEIFESNHQL